MMMTMDLLLIMTLVMTLKITIKKISMKKIIKKNKIRRKILKSMMMIFSINPSRMIIRNKKRLKNYLNRRKMKT